MQLTHVALLVAGPLCLLLFVLGLNAQHQQRLSGRKEGRVLAGAITALCFLGSAAFAYLLWLRLWVASVLSGT